MDSFIFPLSTSLAPKHSAREMAEAKLVRLVCGELEITADEARALLAREAGAAAAEFLASAERGYIDARIAEERAEASLVAAHDALRFPWDGGGVDEEAHRLYMEASDMYTSAGALSASASALCTIARSRLRAALADARAAR